MLPAEDVNSPKSLTKLVEFAPLATGNLESSSWVLWSECWIHCRGRDRCSIGVQYFCYCGLAASFITAICWPVVNTCSFWTLEPFWRPVKNVSCHIGLWVVAFLFKRRRKQVIRLVESFRCLMRVAFSMNSSYTLWQRSALAQKRST